MIDDISTVAMMALHNYIDENSPEEIFMSDESLGICLECGEIDEGVEPDAENYQCNSCSKHAVCGIETAIVSYI